MGRLTHLRSGALGASRHVPAHAIRRFAPVGVALLTASLSALGCGRRDPAPRAAQSTPTTVAAAPAAASRPELAPLEWAPSKDQLADSLFGPRADSSDLGVGLVALRIHGGAGDSLSPYTDTLHFRAAPRADAPVVAALVLGVTDPAMWRYEMLGPRGTRINVREYAYEESGVPVDSIAGRWARAVVGWDTAGARVLGWADASDTTRVELVRWADYLRERVWYFLDPKGARVYASLADTAGPGDALPEGYDIEALETRGRWMRMRLLWPYDKCEGQDSTKATRREVWAEYLDQRGRPKVFYPSRGC